MGICPCQLRVSCKQAAEAPAQCFIKAEQQAPEVSQEPVQDYRLTDDEAEAFEREMMELLSGSESRVPGAAGQAFPPEDDGEDAQKTGYSGLDTMPSECGGCRSPILDSLPETLQVATPPASPHQATCTAGLRMSSEQPGLLNVTSLQAEAPGDLPETPSHLKPQQ